jgi:RNA polymerase sigma-70 factor (ECF subfamily)
MTVQPTPARAAAEFTDAEVIARVLEGETALFEILMRRYNQRIYRAIRAIVRDESDAEDVMQQTYINAFAHLRQFAGRSQFPTWLTRIAINEALLRVRPKPVAIGGLEDDGAREIESPMPNPEQMAVASELSRVVEGEIGALPEAYRTVIMLREVEGLSTAETAECLSEHEDVVKTRLSRARAMLRDNLYKRAGLGMESLFTFGHARCDRVVAAVLEKVTTL